jgi:hypothetical protein
MSNALAISGVTAVLENLLVNVYAGAQLGSVAVSAIAPDLIQIGPPSGSSIPLQVNLFLHQVTYNAAWRNVGQPSVAADGKTRLGNPPLALDLHYLLTAYGSEDCEAEALLGFAIQLVHQTPVIPRSQIVLGLASLPATNPVSGLLSASGLADQIEMIKITPATLGREELAWLWTALKADYRPTFPFQASVVLIESQFPVSAGPPVLNRNITAQPGPSPQLFDVVPPTDVTSIAVGTKVTVNGQSLGGADRVALVNQRLGIQYPPFPRLNFSENAATFTIPNDPVHFPAGVYSLAMLFTGGGGPVQNSTNFIPLAIAPLIVAPLPTVTPSSTGLLVTVNCTPQVRPNQTVTFALGGTTVPAVVFDTPTSTLSFQFPALLAGTYLARLRVDGVESPVQLTTTHPPSFNGPWVTV